MTSFTPYGTGVEVHQWECVLCPESLGENGNFNSQVAAGPHWREVHEEEVI